MQTELEQLFFKLSQSFERDTSHEEWKKRLAKRGESAVITFYLDPYYLEKIDKYIYSGLILTRSEFFRQAILWKILDIFPAQGLFFFDDKAREKRKCCSIKITRNMKEILHIIGKSIDGGYSVFIRRSIIDLLSKYQEVMG